MTKTVVHIKRGGKMRNNLKSCRIERGYTQKEFAEKLTITERQYQRIESGEQDGTMKLWRKIKRLLARSIDFLEENSTN